MLYLDSSILVKRYAREEGSDRVLERFHKGERIFTSAISYAEVLSALGRKLRDRELSQAEFETETDRFALHWAKFLNVLPVDTKTMSYVKDLLKKHSLKAADAIQLSAALWLRDTYRFRRGLRQGDTGIEFGAADESLARIALEFGLAVFNPEERD